MRHPHNGVLLPESMDEASIAEKDAYAAETRRSNGAFIAAYFALEDAAHAAGQTAEWRELDERA